MLNHLKNEASKTYTENGAVTYSTSGSDCLDLFATIGALRHLTEQEIYDRFIRAFTENPDLAMKLLFFARDVRGGLGERRTFRVIINRLSMIKRDTVIKNIKYIAEYGRYDDILALLGTSCEKEALEFIKNQLYADIKAMEEGGEVSLLAKWLPSVNATNRDTVKTGKFIAKACGMSEKEYRKTLSGLRAYIKILENHLREKDYTFDYRKQPSKALYKYRAAFIRNDYERYNEFIQRVVSGKDKLNASTLAPYELVDPYLDYFGCGKLSKLSGEEAEVLNATWKSLPEYECEGDALAVVDTSGSMFWNSHPMPASVALSLGLYFAEHNVGRFANHFITFSESPELIEVKGDTFVDRLRFIANFGRWGMNTNLEAVFSLVLNAAVEGNLPQNEMPKRLIIISDMEFDSCVEDADKTVFESAKKRFEEKGYSLPEVVFWNVNSRHENLPVRMNENGVKLVSGCMPKLFEMVMKGTANPYEFMLEVLNSERYECIVA